jgi:hypothetical protein
MGFIRSRLKWLEKESREEFIEVPQKDGTIRRFPRSAGIEALLCLIDGEDHPLAEAARNSPDLEWSNSFYNAFPMPDDAEDLSEQT